MTVATLRVPHARAILAGIALAFGAAVVILSRGYNFYFDEWYFILAAPNWSFISFLEPHNEHPAMLHKLLYAALLNTVGLRTYVPYMAVLLAVHATNAVLLFELVRRRAGEAVALAAAMLLLFLGAGWENILWAFQVSFDGSVAFGLAALLVIQRGWIAAAVVLLAASVMCSGVGLFFVVAVAVYLVADPARRRELLWMAPLALLIAAWYLALGRSGTTTNPPPTPANVAVLPAYAAWGIGEAAAGVIGEGGWWGPPALVAAIGVTAWSWRRQRPDGVALGATAGLLSFYVVTGLSRAQFGYEQSGAGRYVYEGAVFWLILLASAARELPWRGTWRPALAACLFLACFNSGALLFAFGAAKSAQMQREGADLQALSAARTHACATARVDALVMPQVAVPALYYRAVGAFGDPAPPGPVTDRADYDRALANLTSGCS